MLLGKLSFMACLAVLYFSILFHEWHVFRKTYFLDLKCILIFFKNFSETFLILIIIQRHIVTHVHTSSCKVPIVLVRL